MIDPVTAITVATTAFNTVKRLVDSGKEFEDVAQQLAKWYGAASDLSKAKEDAKNPPVFKKLFTGSSVEEEALQILIHTKKLKEQEKQLKAMLNMRYGYGAWDELVQLRRKVRKQRQETVYKQLERKQAIIEAISWVAAIILFLSISLGGFYVLGSFIGKW